MKIENTQGQRAFSPDFKLAHNLFVNQFFSGILASLVAVSVKNAFDGIRPLTTIPTITFLASGLSTVLTDKEASLYAKVNCLNAIFLGTLAFYTLAENEDTSSH